MEFIILGLATYYVTMILIFDIEDIGAFPSATTFIKQAVGERIFTKPVDLFDRFRYLFGAYRIEKDSEGQVVWFVRPFAMLVWACPYCLCFWVSIIFGLIQFFVPESQLVFQLLGLAGFVHFLARWKV